jgi:hypothetical protein
LDLIKRHYGLTEKFREYPYRFENNVYPVNRLIWAKDMKYEGLEFGVVIDTPSGATYLPSGELMIHLQRYLSTSDNKGMSDRVKPKSMVHKEHVIFYGKNLLKKMRREQLSKETEDLYLLLEYDKKRSWDIKADL